MIEFLFLLYYLVICFACAYVNILVITGEYPLWMSGFTNLFFNLGGIGMLKFSSLPLAKQSMFITAVISVGYFLALTYFGESVSKFQWIGLGFILIGATFLSK